MPTYQNQVVSNKILDICINHWLTLVKLTLAFCDYFPDDLTTSFEHLIISIT